MNGMSRLGARSRPRAKLIPVEGIDGPGKSTQLHLLDKWLRHLSVLVFNTEWNSSAILKEMTPKTKKKALLTPTTLSLVQATYFADRYMRNVLPLLRAGCSRGRVRLHGLRDRHREGMPTPVGEESLQLRRQA